MTFKIIQYFVGNDSKYKHLCDLVQNINRMYCKIHNYNYQLCIIPEEQIKKYYGECSYYYITGYKVKFIQDMLQKQDADYLVCIDADAAVSKPQIKFEDLIDEQHSIFLSRGNDRWLQLYLTNILYNKLTQFRNEKTLLKDYYDEDIMKQKDMFVYGDRLSYGSLMFNQGFIIIKNDQLMREFFADCYNNQQILKQIPYSKMPLDGRSIAFTLLYQKYNKSYKFMYPQAQGCFACSYETKYDLEKTFILHNFGQAFTLEQRTKAINDLLNNKWWKQIQEIQ